VTRALSPTPVEYTAFFPFGGLGAGALGFLRARAELLGRRARFQSVGSIDICPEACADFEALTGSPALCADVATLTSAQLRGLCPRAPDVVFSSPPCKGYSGLLSTKKSKSAKYQALNRLVLDWVRLMLRTWDEPPKLFLLENVPRIASRGKKLLKAVKRMLSVAGYVFHATTHDCGEVGGLAQHRKRYLLVARHQRRVAPLLYQPPKKRVRACGEVLGPLPMPEDPAGGPMHRLPRISWLNWVRLALIPAGGDWRDLPGVLETGQARREVHRRHPRVRVAYDHGYGVLRWDEPSSTVAAGSHPGQGAYSVADIRVEKAFNGTYGVMSWEDAAGTITGNARLDTGRFSVADPRKPPPELRVIISADGTWHRPLTTLELAALQGLPTVVDGKPLQLAGRAVSRWRERIGNAVPVQTAQAIAAQMLEVLVCSDADAFVLSSTPVWVSPRRPSHHPLEATS